MALFVTNNSQDLTPRTIITKLAFRNRFTINELIAIELTSIDNPAADLATRQLAALLRVMQKNQENASYIDLSRTDTQQGVQMMESYGLLAAGRANEILHAPVKTEEVPIPQ